MSDFNYPIKDPADVLDYGVDFTAQLALDKDSINSTPVVTITPPGMTFPSSGVMVGGIAVARGVSSGTAGVHYRFDVTVTTVNGNTYKRGGIIPVYPR